MTEPTKADDNYDTLPAPELRRLLREKQDVVVKVLSENQTAVSMRLRAENAHRQAEAKTEKMAAELLAVRNSLSETMRQRDLALLFATTLYEKLVYLSNLNGKARDVKKVVELLHFSMEEVSRITRWPEVAEMDLINKLFSKAERRVFGRPGETK